MGRRVLAVSVVALLMGVLALPGLASHQEPGGTFTDDDGSVHEGYIEALVAEGITSGCGPALFCPDDPVTRGQMAAFLVRAKGYTDGAGSDRFSDDDDSIFEADIERLAEAGVTLGCDPPANTSFCPDDSVTRGQMAAFLVRAFGYSDGAGSDRFSDDDDSVFEADIERLAEAGVTLGCDPPANTRFCPGDDVTRAQMATFLGRALGLTPDTPPPPTTTTTSIVTTTGVPPTSGPAPVIHDVRVGIGTTQNVFSPDDLTINESDTLRFTNEGGFHNLVFGDGADGVDAASADLWQFDRVFTDAGVYTFFCQVHAGMDGQVTVDG